MQRKVLIISVISLAAFAGEASHTAHLSAYVVQAATFQKTPTEMLYSVCASAAGTVVGPFIFAPLVNVLGRSSTVFWSLVATLGCQIWAAKMTAVDDYIPFVLSRLLAGLFALIPATIGSGYILEMFFLHQRGKVFACFQLAVLLGVIGSGTIGGFVVNSSPWPLVFWWTLGPLGAAIILVFIFAEETTFTRDDLILYPRLPTTWLANRTATFFMGNRTVPHLSLRQLAKRAVIPFIIAATPVTIVTGLYLFFTFGFPIVVTSLLTLYLQTPEAVGGYGFSPLRNACFTLIVVVSMFAAQISGVVMADAVPLWVTRRFGNGVWRPEYRLANIVLPIIILPMGLGIFGASVQYHLHYMVLGLGLFLVGFSAQFNTPICYNYIIECFRNHPIEATITMNAYRLVFGVAILFFVQPWSEAVSPGWLFGMMAFFSVLVGILMFGMVLKGYKLRKYNLDKEIAVSEEGERLTEKGITPKASLNASSEEV